MRLTFKSIRQIILFIIILILLIMAVIFEFLPVVEQAREAFPKEFNNNYSCYDVLNARPWHGKFNGWFWSWVLIVPLIISFMKPTMPKWQRRTLTLLAIIICYPLMVLAFHLSWDLGSAPFMNGGGIVHSGDVLLSSKEDVFKHNCYNIGGAGLGFISLFAWMYASFYVGFCFLLRKMFRAIQCALQNADFTKW